MGDANIRAVITAKDEASSVLKSFGNSASSVGNKLASVAKVAAVGLAAAGAAAVGFGVLSVKAYSDSEDKLTQLNAVLKSTGGVAGWTADQAVKLSKSLQSMTKYSDEDVLSVENLLLTFTSIGKDIMPQATSTVLDMATALGEDTKSASIQLGKALQDPVLGVTALRRVGVNFNDSQKEVIKNLVATGQSAKAQALILKELKTEFGGSAEAAGGTFSGNLAKLKNQFNDLQESVGLMIVKGLTPLLSKFNEWLNRMGGAEGIFNSLRRTWDLLTQGFTEGDPFNQGEESKFNLILLTIHDNLIKLKDFAVLAFAKFKEVVEFLTPSLEALWNTVENKLYPSLLRWWKEVVIPLAPAVGTVLVGAIWVLINAINVLVQVMVTIQNAFISIFTFVTVTLPKGIEDFANLAVAKFNWLRDNWAEAIGWIIGFVASLPVKLAALIVESNVAMVKAAMDVDWGKVAVRIFDAFVAYFNQILHAGQALFEALIHINWGNLFGAINKGIGNSIIGLVEGAINGALAGLPGKPHVGLPRFAAGTDFAPGGAALVGERGPEIVNLPRGSQVVPNDKIGGTGTVVNVTFSGVFTGNQMEFRKLAKQVFSAYADAKGMGTA